MERNSAPRLSLDCPSTELVFDKQFVHEIHAVVFVVENGTPSSSDRLASNIVMLYSILHCNIVYGNALCGVPFGKKENAMGFMDLKRPTNTRSKADFRVLRATLGVSARWVAEMSEFTPLTVNMWEGRKYAQVPRREAWDLLEAMWREADQRASELVAEAQGRDHPERPFMMRYHFGMSPYDEDRERVMEEIVSNAAVRMAVDRLSVLGIQAELEYAEEQE